MINDVHVYKKNRSWPTVIPAAVALMVQHLHHEHGLTIRAINRRLGLTDAEVRACLEEN